FTSGVLPPPTPKDLPLGILNTREHLVFEHLHRFPSLADQLAEDPLLVWLGAEENVLILQRLAAKHVQYPLQRGTMATDRCCVKLIDYGAIMVADFVDREHLSHLRVQPPPSIRFLSCWQAELRVIVRGEPWLW